MIPSYYQKYVEHILYSLKRQEATTVPSEMITQLPNKKILTLRVITENQLRKGEHIRRLALWRETANVWFPNQFNVTFDSTKKWAKEMLLEKSDRILFYLYFEHMEMPFGHVGLYRFNYDERSAEIDNIIRGEKIIGTEGAMTNALQLLVNWSYKYLHLHILNLQVFSDNIKAIRLYERIGFQEIKRVRIEYNVNERIKNKFNGMKKQSVNRVIRFNKVMQLPLI